MTLSAEAIQEIRRGTEDVLDRIHTLADIEGLFFHEERMGESIALKAHDLERFLPYPRRKAGKVVVHRFEDFVNYVAAHDEATTIFANRDQFIFTAFLNYHAGHSATETAAGWGDHVAEYRVQDTPEWASWKRLANAGYVAQDAFVEFLEDHLEDITVPDARGLFETVTDLRLRSGATYERGIRLANGTVQFTYREEVEQEIQQGQVEIPERLTLALRLWEGETEPTQLVPRLRHKLQGGKVSFSVIFGDDVQRMLRDRFNAFAGAIEERLAGIPVLFGQRVS